MKSGKNMFFGLFYGDWTVLILLPAIIFSIIAQARVNSTFDKFNRVATMRRISGAEAARRILDKNGLGYLQTIVYTEP